jgi:thymidylate synthase
LKGEREEGRIMERTHTWESECLPKLELRNAATGDIAVCTLWTPLNRISPYLNLPRINIVGPLRTKMGLGWLLRGLYLYPAIRNLVICGKDLARTGDALLTLWEEGLTEDNILPGLGCKLYPEIDREAVNLLRKYVKVWDWRTKSLEEVGRDISNIPCLTREMEPRSFPGIVIPQQNTFSSRKTTFPLFAEEVGDGWLQLVNLVMHCGTVKGTRRGERLIEVLNAIVTMKLASEEATLPPCFDFGADEFEAHYGNFVSLFPPEDVDYTCGERLQNWSWFNQEDNTTERLNQFERTIARLQRSHDTKRGTVVLLGPTDLDRLDDAPCIVLVTFNIVDERLYGTYVMRSDDIYNAWPFNALSLIRLQREVSKRIGIPVDSATFISHSAHIYERDWDKAWAKLDKWFKRPLPFQADCSGLFFFSLENGLARALFVSPEVDRVLWEGESRDPQDLIRHIVDTMPWLTAQHIRYLGEEAAKLSRALEEGLPYEQG